MVYLIVADRAGRVVFSSGSIHPDGRVPTFDPVPGIHLRDVFDSIRWESELRPYFLAALEGRSGSLMIRDGDDLLSVASDGVYGAFREPIFVRFIFARIPSDVLSESKEHGVVFDPTLEI